MEIEFRDLCKEDKEYFFPWIKDEEVIRYSINEFINKPKIEVCCKIDKIFCNISFLS